MKSFVEDLSIASSSPPRNEPSEYVTVGSIAKPPTEDGHFEPRPDLIVGSRTSKHRHRRPSASSRSEQAERSISESSRPARDLLTELPSNQTIDAIVAEMEQLLAHHQDQGGPYNVHPRASAEQQPDIRVMYDEAVAALTSSMSLIASMVGPIGQKPPPKALTENGPPPPIDKPVGDSPNLSAMRAESDFESIALENSGTLPPDVIPTVLPTWERELARGAPAASESTFPRKLPASSDPPTTTRGPGGKGASATSPQQATARHEQGATEPLTRLTQRQSVEQQQHKDRILAARAVRAGEPSRLAS